MVELLLLIGDEDAALLMMLAHDDDKEETWRNHKFVLDSLSDEECTNLSRSSGKPEQ